KYDHGRGLCDCLLHRCRHCSLGPDFVTDLYGAWPMKDPVKVQVCGSKCAGLQCARCCGDSRLKTPSMIDYQNCYDFGCCARCRSKAATYLVNGQRKEAGETCGLYNPGWRWKGKQK